MIRRLSAAPKKAPPPPPAAPKEVTEGTQAWVVSNAPGTESNGVWFTNDKTELIEISTLARQATVVSYGFGESGEIAAREAWSHIRTDVDPVVAAARHRKLISPQHVTIAIAMLMGLVAWRVTSALMASRDLPVAAGLLTGAIPFYVDPDDRAPLVFAMFNFLLRFMYHVARLANQHGAVTCTLIGMFFLIRGEPPSQSEPDEPELDEAPDETLDETDSDVPSIAGISGTEITPHATDLALHTPCCPALFSPPRADLFTHEQAGQLHH